ncbi:T9SS type A sorting domain-containing protein [Saccharicrinis sp. FJH2]|uniref:T9SS type A sorting domain-containing protein n=1 Tax=Saccharicrinis sp. FJH65 TaxID=3344659 RepID=UPI0035F4B1F2
MRKRIFTFIAIATLGCGLGLYAQDTGTGTGWETLNPGSPKVLDEDFSGFDFYGNWDLMANRTTDSKPVTDDETLETIPANISGSKTVKYLNSDLEVIYTWDSCAFAPQWGVAASMESDGTPIEPDPTTPGVSDGFVEIARLGYGNKRGEFYIDLRAMEFVEAIQYSHSSCGGQRRGFMVLFSLDDGANWDTLRYQPGDAAWASSFTKDPFTLEKTESTFNCTPSAKGMLWEDAIYAENVMLQIRPADPVQQAVRIHDFKVYGDLPSANQNIQNDLIKVFSYKNTVKLNKVADIEIFKLNGQLVKSEKQTNLVTLDDAPSGIYLVKVQSGNYIKTSKLVLYK